MLLVILLTQVALTAISYRVNRSQKLIGTLYITFNIWWSLLLIVSYFFPYGGYKISSDTYILIWIFLTVFNSFFLLSCSKKKSNHNINIVDDKKSLSKMERLPQQYVHYILNNKKLTVILYVVTILLVFYAIRYSSIMTLDNVLNARNERFYVGGLFKSTYELLFYNFFVSAFRYYFSFVVAFSLLFGMVKNRQFILCLLDLLLYSYIGSSRLPLVLLIVSVLLMWIIRNSCHDKRKDTHNIKRFLFVICAVALGLFGMSYLTAFRRGMLDFSFKAVMDNFNILNDQILNYCIGPLSGLSYLYDSGVMKNHLFFGRAVILNGFDELLSYLLGFMGIHFSYAKNELGAISNVSYEIGNTTFNALFTCIYWFYSDFGIAGVFLFSGLFAYVEKRCIVLFLDRINIFSMMLLVHVAYFMMMSNMIWQITNLDSLLYIIVLSVMYKKTKNVSSIQADT